MKKQPKRFLAAVLLLAVTVGMLACRESGDDPVESGSDTPAGTEQQVGTGPEAVDFKGAAFRVLCYDPSENAQFPYSEIESEEPSSNLLIDAIYLRNSVIKEKYNIVFQAVHSTRNPWEEAQRSYQSQSDDYDVVMPNINGAMLMAQNGMAVSADEIPHINIENDWWMQGINEDTSFKGKNFFLASYTNIRVLDAALCLLFNQKIADEMKLPDLYQLVDQDDWTMARFMELCRGVTGEVNGDQVMDEKDRYGFVTNNGCWGGFMMGFGEQIISKDRSDIPSLAITGQSFVDKTEELISFLNDATLCLLAERYTGYPVKDHTLRGSIPGDAFVQDRGLFFPASMGGIRTLTNMESDFGILPYPKYDDTQEQYSAFVHTSHASVSCVMITSQQLDMIGRLMEDMAYESYTQITPKLQKTLMQDRITRDEDSKRMIDIIYDGMHIDLGFSATFTVDNDVRTLIAQGNTAVSSTLAGNEAANGSKLQQMIDAFDKVYY